MVLVPLFGLLALVGAIVVALSLVTGTTLAIVRDSPERMPKRGRSHLYWPNVGALGSRDMIPNCSAGFALARLIRSPRR
jgi:hypothetical protein